MPYSRSLPPVPIDKGKQGGKTIDSSDITDFKKISVISSVENTKYGFNNKNIYTNTSEQWRSNVMIQGLRTIPILDCQICVGPTGGSSGGVPVVPGPTGSTASTGATGSLGATATAALPPNAITALSGVSFYIMNAPFRFRGGSSSTNYFSIAYDPATAIITRGSWTPGGGTAPSSYPDRISSFAFEGSTYLFQRVNHGILGLGTFSGTVSRATILSTLNGRLALDSSKFTVDTNGGTFLVSGGVPGAQSYLQADLTPDGRLILSIVGNWYTAATTPQSYVGLYFGSGPNGSTTLGVTTRSGSAICGVAATGLLIPGGQRTITSNYQVADLNLDFSAPAGGSCPIVTI
jgi:hypothetical protein